MNKQFVTKNIAKELKNLGFKEQCFAYYNGRKLYPIDTDFVNFRGLDEMLTPAPLWQQVEQWFREKHNLDVRAYPVWINDKFDCYNPFVNVFYVDEEYDTYEEAREQAVLKALELIKTK